jgi:two-component system LytT family response regulator
VERAQTAWHSGGPARAGETSGGARDTEDSAAGGLSGNASAVAGAPEEILWFQVEDGLVKAHTATDTFWVNYQLGELEAGLPADLFFRARREVLVNLARIKEIKPYFKSGFLLTMADAAGTEIAISERQSRSFRQRIPGL